MTLNESTLRQRKESVKAYKDPDFINSKEARPIRILSEYLKPEKVFDSFNIQDTIVFFGSARTKSKEETTADLKAIEEEIARASEVTEGMKEKLEFAKRQVQMSKYYEDAVALAKELTLWSKNMENHKKRFIICSGGGPGIMEAANKGASLAKGLSIGLNISLPFEQLPNQYITDALSLEFHYFFMRKFWFMYLAKAIVIFPGGFGTIDELMEALTLIQTDKLRKKMSIVLFGKEYWDEVLNFDTLVKWGTIDKEDVELFYLTDDYRDAFEYLKTELTRNYLS